MKNKKIIAALVCASTSLYATSDKQLQQEIRQLQSQTQAMQSHLAQLQKELNQQNKQTHKHAQKHADKKTINKKNKKAAKPAAPEHTKHHQVYHTTNLTIHSLDEHPNATRFYPTALVAENKVVTYIAGTPVVSSPYLGSRPAFDGSDYIVNISSINRDIRLMQQRRRMYSAYRDIGYPVPPMPIISLSGKAEPIGVLNSNYNGTTNADLTLGSSELNVAAALNENVEAYIAIAYDSAPPEVGPRIDNSAFNLNLGFINIGNLDKTPYYFSAGQLYVPFGRYASSMISAPMVLNLARTKTRPFIVGYKSQYDAGPFAAAYIYRSDTTLGKSGVGGANLGYVFQYGRGDSGEVGVSYISNIADSSGMQNTGSPINTTFAGFGSFTNGNEMIRKTPAIDLHANFGYGRFIFTTEWVSSLETFRVQDLSFNGEGAMPQAGQAEVAMTFRAFNRPASFGTSYQWSKEALALNLPAQSAGAVFSISIWKDTVESIEYRHDWDYDQYQFANGAAPLGQVNATTYGTGGSADTVSLQIGVYF